MICIYAVIGDVCDGMEIVDKQSNSLGIGVVRVFRYEFCELVDGEGPKRA